ncbi:hypothetical protein [Marinobacter sp. F4216]|uniref:hypothetical protein n=1 Tax=Marinobacter sp. F4216 TaxID=2874281 RepID=UPI001CC1177F|nr:hypothetical protein [Marinobacter sp. F4216]MBZ2169462.1 hypothetical protein [Marinobacter sp. F4216]
MFLLNNIHDRDYKKVYPNISGVIFDLSDSQIANARNSEWHDIKPGAIVCVLRSSRKMSTFFRVSSIRKTEVTDDAGGYQHVLIGDIIGKLPKDIKMTDLLNTRKVNHPYLPDNKLSIGFNVANLGDALSELKIKIKNGTCNLSELEPKIDENI